MLPETLAAYFQSVAHSLPWWLLWVGAWVGHGYLFIVALNVFYGWPLPHKVLKYTRKIDMLIVLSGPILFWYALDLGDSQALTWERISLRYYLASYTVICWIIGVTIAPVCEIFYLARRTAPQLIQETRRTVDVEHEIGYSINGHGKDARLCNLPFNQCFQVEFTEKVLLLPQLPAAWDGLSILHLTDLHLCGTPDRAFYQYVLDRCMREGIPDLLLLTGDVVDSEWHHRWIVPLLGRLRWNVGAFAILGNHDYWRDVSLVRRRLRRVGMTVLGNSWQQRDVRGVPMILIGHEGPWFTPAPDLSTCPEEIFRLCLSHTPDNIRWAQGHHIDLVLAGHVHGGQVRLPVLGSVFVPSRHSRKYDCGTFYEAPTVMHVSRGLAGQHPLRFFCKPEVTRIVLRKRVGKD